MNHGLLEPLREESQTALSACQQKIRLLPSGQQLVLGAGPGCVERPWPSALGGAAGRHYESVARGGTFRMLTGERQQATSRPSTPPGTAAVLLAHQGLEHVHELLSSCKASSRRRSPLLNQATVAPVLGLDRGSPGGGRDDARTCRGHTGRRTGGWAAPWACATPSPPPSAIAENSI